MTALTSGPATEVQAGYTGERKKEVIGLVVGLAVLAYTLTAAPPAGLSGPAWKTIGVSLLMAIWWVTEALPIAFTSLVPLVAFPVLGIIPAAQIAPNYATDQIWLFFGGFTIAYAMEMWGLHKRFSLWTLKICGTNPKMLILGFLVSTGFLSAWMSNTACAALMMPIGLSMVKMVQESKSSSEAEKRAALNFGICVMLGIAYAASIGGMATLIGTPPNSIMAALVNKMTGVGVPFASFAMVGAPISIILTVVCWWLLPALFPVRDLNLSDVGSVVDEEIEKLGPMSKGEKWTTVVFLVTAILWIFRPQVVDLFGSVMIAGKSVKMTSMITDATVGMVASVACFLIPIDFKRGKMLMDSSLLTKGIPWDAMILFGGGFAMGEALTASGVSQFIGSQMTGLQGMSPLVITFTMAMIAMILTQMTSNTAVAAAFCPLAIAAAQGMGVNPLFMAIPTALGASIAFSLPVATPPNAIVFGSGLLKVSDMFKAGMILNIIGIIVTVAVMMLMLPIAFGG